MMRVSRRPSRGNTALAHAYDLDVEPSPSCRQRHPDGSPAPDLLGGIAEETALAIGDPGQGRLLLLRGRRSQPALLRLSLRVAYQTQNMRRDRRPFRG
jgi:GcrA cell cycle regulator